jgi:hypothetical protein
MLTPAEIIHRPLYREVRFHQIVDAPEFVEFTKYALGTLPANHPVPALLDRAAAVEIAKSRHADRCRAWWHFWTHGGREPNDLDFGFHHGWFDIAGHSIGAHEYAPGPTYNVD